MGERPLSESRLLFCIGPARCGKSTFGRKWRDEKPGRVVWTQDNLRLAMAGRRYTRTLEPLIHAQKAYIIKSLLLGGHEVLVDGTHTSERSIKDILAIDVDARPILFSTSLEECTRRAVQTDQSDLIPVIQRHCFQRAQILFEGLDAFMERMRAEVREYDEYRWAK
jgi:hypothetical protein